MNDRPKYPLTVIRSLVITAELTVLILAFFFIKPLAVIGGVVLVVGLVGRMFKWRG